VSHAGIDADDQIENGNQRRLVAKIMQIFLKTGDVEVRKRFARAVGRADLRLQTDVVATEVPRAYDAVEAKTSGYRRPRCGCALAGP